VVWLRPVDLPATTGRDQLALSRRLNTYIALRFADFGAATVIDFTMMKGGASKERWAKFALQCPGRDLKPALIFPVANQVYRPPCLPLPRP
jgi:hypothetical protein